MPLPAGTFIKGRYALAGLPKCGGMAEVYKAFDVRDNGRPVAVKVLTSVKFGQDILAETFKRETQALGKLRHPGIVELIDAGTDEATGKPFLVLEWVEANLIEWVKKSPPAGWDSFYDDIGKHVLEALAFAHAHDVKHRDVKPGNILMTKDGHAKLGDFGISKSLSIQAGLTLREFMSRPYTPPEIDDGQFTASRDVFGFGAVVLSCLTDVKLTDYPDIKKALAQFDAPPNVREQIARAVDFNPAERPATADVLLAELQRIQQERMPKSSRRRCNLEFRSKGIKDLQTVLQIESYQEVTWLLRDDLNQACGVRPYRGSGAVGNAQNVEDQYNLFGVSYQYHVRVSDSARHLFVFGAWPMSSAALERQRDQAWCAPFELGATGGSTSVFPRFFGRIAPFFANIQVRRS